MKDLLVVLSRIPYPLEKGDKLRAYHLLARLADNYRVHLFCLSDGPVVQADVDHLASFCTEVKVVRIPRWRIALRMLQGLVSRLPFQVLYFHHRAAHKELEDMIARVRPDHVLCQLVRTTEYLRHRNDLARTVDLMDTLSKGMERRARTAPWWSAPVFRSETRRLIAYENRMLDLFDGRVIISEQDRKHLYHPERDAVVVVPNGVDTEHFKPNGAEPRYDLVFTGNMSYPPNMDSVVYLAQHVLPLVRSVRPGTTLLISGVDPGPRVRELAADPGIIVTGRVEDIRDSYAAAKVFVAPMQIGTGLQNKLLEAMAMGMPCITSVLANNAVGAEPGLNILVGDTPQDHAAHILHLLEDPAARQRLGAAGRAFVRNGMGWDRAAEKLGQVVEEATREHRRAFLV